MGIGSLLAVAVGLAMDAFAVSMCKGLAMQKITLKKCCIVGLWFGGFQALMPVIGYFVGLSFAEYVNRYSHWIALLLLVAIGVNMIREAVSGEDCEENDNIGIKTMFIMAVATSIDALAVGISFALQKTNIVLAAAIIGIITFIISAIGVKIGNIFGSRYKNKAEIAGGIILILIGIKIAVDGVMQ